MIVPTTWKTKITLASSQLSSLRSSMAAWMPSAATTRKSYRLTGAPSGHHRCVASNRASIAPPNRQAQACLIPNIRNSNP